MSLLAKVRKRKEKVGKREKRRKFFEDKLTN